MVPDAVGVASGAGGCRGCRGGCGSRSNLCRGVMERAVEERVEERVGEERVEECVGVERVVEERVGERRGDGVRFVRLI